MKKLLILSTLIPSICFSATTGTLSLSGTIPKVVSIVVNATPGASNLDLSTTQTNLQVATVIEHSNSVNGYVVSVASLNAGLLKNSTLGNVVYTAKYNNVSFTLSTTPQSITSVGSQLVTVNTSKPLTISYPGNPQEDLMSGDYTDTLTFTISAN